MVLNHSVKHSLENCMSNRWKSVINFYNQSIKQVAIFRAQYTHKNIDRKLYGFFR